MSKLVRRRREREKSRIAGRRATRGREGEIARWRGTGDWSRVESATVRRHSTVAFIWPARASCAPSEPTARSSMGDDGAGGWEPSSWRSGEQREAQSGWRPAQARRATAVHRSWPAQPCLRAVGDGARLKGEQLLVARARCGSPTARTCLVEQAPLSQIAARVPSGLRFQLVHQAAGRTGPEPGERGTGSSSSPPSSLLSLNTSSHIHLAQSWPLSASSTSTMTCPTSRSRTSRSRRGGASSTVRPRALSSYAHALGRDRN